MRRYSKPRHSMRRRYDWNINETIYFLLGFGAGVIAGFGLWMALWVGNA